jgi:hypothetical protein
MTVMDLKGEILMELDVPTTQQRLLLKGKVLAPDECLLSVKGAPRPDQHAHNHTPQPSVWPLLVRPDPWGWICPPRYGAGVEDGSVINLVAKKVVAKKDENFSYAAALGSCGATPAATPAVRSASSGGWGGGGGGGPAASTSMVGEVQLDALGEQFACATAQMAAVSSQLAAFGDGRMEGGEEGRLAAECRRCASKMELVARHLHAAVGLGGRS